MKIKVARNTDGEEIEIEIKATDEYIIIEYGFNKLFIPKEIFTGLLK